MWDRSATTEESFGILTDDELALEATLVRPAGLTHQEIRLVQLWVPKYPLTRTSLLPAARREAAIAGTGSRSVNLVFDLRGSGESDGVPSDEGFEIDIGSAREWAKERFGSQVEIRQLGFPDLGEADRLAVLPLRSGVMAELYCYDPDKEGETRVLYFSGYTGFGRDDDALCRAIAQGGYTVYGGNLMRYLLMAAPLTLETLWDDGTELAAQIGRPLYLIARAFAAGPGLAMAIGVQSIDGVIATGPAQEGLAALNLFSQENPARLMLTRQIRKLAPRPSVFLWNREEAGNLLPGGLRRIYDLGEKPHLWGVVSQITAPILLNALDWLLTAAQQDETEER